MCCCPIDDAIILIILKFTEEVVLKLLMSLLVVGLRHFVEQIAGLHAYAYVERAWPDCFYLNQNGGARRREADDGKVKMKTRLADKSSFT